MVNILLIIGAKKDIKILVVLWLLESIHICYEPRTSRRITRIACISCQPLQFTLGFLIWSFVLVSIMLTYDTSPGFVAFIALAQLLNFAILGRYQRNEVFMSVKKKCLFFTQCSSFVIVVFSFYQELRGDVVKEVLINSSREEEYVQEEEEDAEA